MNFYLFDKHRLREERTTTTTVAASVEAELLSSRERRTTTAGGFALCHLGLFFLREILMLSSLTQKRSALVMVRIPASIVSLLSAFESSARAPRRNFDVDDNSCDFRLAFFPLICYNVT